MNNVIKNLLPISACVTMLASCNGGSVASEPDVAPLPATSATGLTRLVEVDDLPGWDDSDLRPALHAFRRTCVAFESKNKSVPLASDLRWAGTYGDWQLPCARVGKIRDSARASRVFFEDNFIALKIPGDRNDSRITAYYEPEVIVSPEPEEGLAAIPGVPADLAVLKLSDFDPRLDDRTFVAQFRNNRVAPYPPRTEIVDAPERALGYAYPMDVFYLQIQGSGRLVFPRNKVVRAVFAAHNGHEYKSISNYLLETGQIGKAQTSEKGIKAWARSVDPELVRAAINANPRYVWFVSRPLEDAREGPKGALGVPLTPMGSMAIDPDHYPLGAPVYIDTMRPAEIGGPGQPWHTLVIAQDTGGAIKGARRGDVFFGSGADAGGLAGNMNHKGSFWVLLPRAMANRLSQTGLDDKGT